MVTNSGVNCHQTSKAYFVLFTCKGTKLKQKIKQKVVTKTTTIKSTKFVIKKCSVCVCVCFGEVKSSKGLDFMLVICIKRLFLSRLSRRKNSLKFFRVKLRSSK